MNIMFRIPYNMSEKTNSAKKRNISELYNIDIFLNKDKSCQMILDTMSQPIKKRKLN